MNDLSTSDASELPLNWVPVAAPVKQNLILPYSFDDGLHLWMLSPKLLRAFLLSLLLGLLIDADDKAKLVKPDLNSLSIIYSKVEGAGICDDGETETVEL